MKYKTFLAYLGYRECEEIETHSIHFTYENKNHREFTSSVPRYEDYEEIHPNIMYQICTNLGIDMPQEFAELQKQLDKIYK